MRISTAVLLTRQHAGQLEVFLVQRNPTLRFFGGYWACPGGVVDPVDRRDSASEDEVHARCALRELFEEAGVLPAELAGRLGADERAGLRRGLLEGPHDSAAAVRFGELLDDAPEALEGVRPFAQLTTPAFAPVRYRTRFVHVELPPGERPHVVEGELTDGAFAPGGAWLRRWKAGELAVVPPVLFLLDMLDGVPLEEFLVRAERRCLQSEAGRLHPICNTPGIVMAPLPTPTLPPATTTNCYIVGEERLVVVDPATYDDTWRERLCALLDERLERGGELAGIFVTHHHRDHVGSVAALEERYGCEVLAHPLTLERLPSAPRRPRPVVDGDEIPLGNAPDGSTDWRLTAYHTPGHDRGHLVLVDERYGAVLAGDLVSTLSTIVIDPPEGHLATYLASLRRVRDLPIGMIHPAHGPVAREGTALLDEYLAHRAAREGALVAALERGLSDRDALLDEVYRELDPRLRVFARRSLQAGLDKLAEEGRALPSPLG